MRKSLIIASAALALGLSACNSSADQAASTEANATDAATDTATDAANATEALEPRAERAGTVAEPGTQIK